MRYVIAMGLVFASLMIGVAGAIFILHIGGLQYG